MILIRCDYPTCQSCTSQPIKLALSSCVQVLFMVRHQERFTQTIVCCSLARDRKMSFWHYFSLVIANTGKSVRSEVWFLWLTKANVLDRIKEGNAPFIHRLLSAKWNSVCLSAVSRPWQKKIDVYAIKFPILFAFALRLFTCMYCILLIVSPSLIAFWIGVNITSKQMFFIECKRTHWFGFQSD